MSLFQTLEATCPACGETVTCEVVDSVNVDRRPELRDEILQRTFQTQVCQSCGENFRIEPRFTYVHMAGKQYLAVWPADQLGDWESVEKHSDESFLRFYGPGTSPAAEQIGRELNRRTVFGWEAAHEKLVALDLGIDDVTLEMAKIALIRAGEGPDVEQDLEIRLLGVNQEQELVFGVFTIGDEKITETIRVPRQLLADIEEDSAGWAALRTRLSEGSFVDMARLVSEPV
jgi:hypothetical protein